MAYFYENKNDARKIVIYNSRVRTKEKLSAIADYYHYQSHSSVNNTVKNIKEKIANECIKLMGNVVNYY